MAGTPGATGAFAKRDIGKPRGATAMKMKETLRSLSLGLALAIGATASISIAQTQSVPPAQIPPCEPTTPGAAGPNGCQSNGVIHPPDSGDHGAVITPPDSTKEMPMPVIPPPGSPGGNSTIQPK